MEVEGAEEAKKTAEKQEGVVERREKGKKTGNKHIWGDGDGGCMEDESERPSLLLEAVMGMI